MKRLSGRLFGVTLLLASALSANRVSLQDMGISVWVPSGWELQNLGRTDTANTYLLDDTTILSNGIRRHSGSILVRAQSGVLAAGRNSLSIDPTRQWVLNEGDAWSLYVSTAPLGGVLFLDDTMLVSGLFAREVFGQSLQAAGDSVYTDYFRTAAHGDVGWDIWAEADTADADSAISTYSDMMDSILVDTTMSILPPVANRARGSHGSASQVLSSAGGAVRIHAVGTPRVEAMDLMGRTVAGTLVFGGDGIWQWRPAWSRTKTVFARVRADGETWTRRLVLDP